MKRIILAIMVVSLLMVGCEKGTDVAREDTNEQVELIEGIETSDDLQKDIERLENEKRLEYIEILKTTLSNLDLYMDEINSSFAKAEENPILFLDNNWKSSTKESFLKISLTNEMLKEIEKEGLTPDGFEDVHKMAIDSFSTMILAGDRIFEGIEDDFNVEKINEGAFTMQDGFDKIKATNKLLKEKQE